MTELQFQYFMQQISIWLKSNQCQKQQSLFKDALELELEFFENL